MVTEGDRRNQAADPEVKFIRVYFNLTIIEFNSISVKLKEV